MSNTSNLVLPYLAVGQAQKHVTVNESLRKLDAIVQLSVVSASTTGQPGAPEDGAVYIIPPGKSGEQWAAFGNGSLGYYRDGAWVEITPREGWLAYVKDSGELLAHDGAGWTLFAPGKVMAVSASDRVLGRVSPGGGAAEEIAFSDAAQQLCDDASFGAMCATLGAWRVLAASAVPVSLTGSTSEVALATVTIPGGAMGPNGMLRITAHYSLTNSGNSKAVRWEFGAGLLHAWPATGVGSLVMQKLVHNRNAEDAQVTGVSGTAIFLGSSTSALITASVDTSVDQDLAFTGQLANSGETLTLESYVVEIAHGA
jgi:hypothetical protein